MKAYIQQLIGEHANILTKKSLVREYLQARVLQALQESGAFLSWAFVGGTALRFLYNIPRYSEDLDFSVSRAGEECGFEAVLLNIKSMFQAENYTITIKVSSPKTVMSAFLKFPGLFHELGISPYSTETVSIKLEIDTNPPAGAVFETKIIRRHVTVQVMQYDKASLFAGKLHAILARSYTKGRDLYDLVWYLSDPTWPFPNVQLLNNALKQTGWRGKEITEKSIASILSERMNELDWKAVAADIQPFLERAQDLQLLTQENCLGLIMDRFSS